MFNGKNKNQIELPFFYFTHTRKRRLQVERRTRHWKTAAINQIQPFSLKFHISEPPCDPIWPLRSDSLIPSSTDQLPVPRFGFSSFRKVPTAPEASRSSEYSITLTRDCLFAYGAAIGERSTDPYPAFFSWPTQMIYSISAPVHSRFDFCL